MKTILKILGVVVALVVVVAVGGVIWAKSTVASMLERTIDVHTVDFPIPFPLDETEVAALRQASDQDTYLDLDTIARERARDRGKHLVEARYACIECYGKDFGGGVMVDDPAIGQLFGPNITTGNGSVTIGYEAADWDRTVRHGVRRDGHPSLMPAEDFQLLSDRELSDIVVYLRSMPPVDKVVAPSKLGPLGTFLAATGKLPLSVDRIEDHHAEHLVEPPPTQATAQFGQHLAGICTGCHGQDLQGGPIPAGPPDWPPAANLTPHPQGLADLDLRTVRDAHARRAAT